MKRLRASLLIGLLVVMAVILTRCGNKPAPPPAGATVPAPSAQAGSASPAPTPTEEHPLVRFYADGSPLPTEAQGKLPTIRLFMGKEEVEAEMALSEKQNQTGMMYRTNVDDNSCMIFPLPAPRQAYFWMANCPKPLTAAYINPQGKILEFHELHPYDTNSVISESYDIYYVLEMNQGWFERHHIAVGTTIVTERGTLEQTFRGTK